MSNPVSKTHSTAALFALFEGTSIGAFLADPSGQVLSLNPSLAARLGNRPRDAVGDFIGDLGPERWHRLTQNLLPAQTLLLAPASLNTAGGVMEAIELRLCRPKDSEQLLGMVFPLIDRQQEAAVNLLQRDVLESVALGRPLRAVLDLLCRQVEALAPEVISSVLRIDEQGRLRPLAGPSLPVAYSSQLDGLEIGEQTGSCGTAAFRGEEVEVQNIDTDPLWASYKHLVLPLGLNACWSTPVFGRDGRVIATFAFYYRETRGPSRFHRRMVDACLQLCRIAIQHEDNQHQIERLAFFDALTGLPNRALLMDRARVALQQAGRDGRKLGMAVLDIDRFKTINDSMGHAAGDELLREVGLRLRSALRDSDTVSRIGGDEFVVLFPDSDANDSAIAAEKVLRAVAQRIEIGGQVLVPTISIGISQFPDDARDFETLMRNADIAMYEAKRDGRGCVRFFLSSMNESARWRLQMESALRLAISREALELHYQPKVLLGKPGLAGVEALVRWTHPELGRIAPDQFIPLAEDCGLINALDAWVLERACAQLSDWLQRGLPIPAMAVNLSAQRFSQDDVPAHVRIVLQRYNLPPQALTLEITERLMLNDEPRIRADLDSLNRLGVHLSVDDFGTGYSSLSYLKRLPVDELKLDRSFVNDIETDPGDRALASAVIGIGKSLGQNVVAEGVETAEQHRFLLEAGCPVAQGYYYARPMAAADIELWLEGDGLRWLRPQLRSV
ncbi:putative bifunctional diguanylate cyclase/phosphodiesterase [Aquimonas sp.]|jgi:diguanylate cyclase (GGDEF)-like protein|uniref:putative bifunctional diguanylate cyclase/phosphodiesterase n=1 Tax=Aquimonas sp. TaxID=1872588 RepID=UPI0037C079E1